MISFRLVPRGVDFGCCVYFYVFCTFVSRLVLLGQLLYCSYSLYAFLNPQFDVDKYGSKVPTSCMDLTIIESGSSYNLYSKCERQNQDELLREYFDNKMQDKQTSFTTFFDSFMKESVDKPNTKIQDKQHEFTGVLFCRGGGEKTKMIYMESDKDDYRSSDIKMWEVLDDPGEYSNV